MVQHAADLHDSAPDEIAHARDALQRAGHEIDAMSDHEIIETMRPYLAERNRREQLSKVVDDRMRSLGRRPSRPSCAMAGHASEG
jgi:hypothetical protein